PTAKAIAIRPACGAENKAEPQTALTSENVPINSAARFRCMSTDLPKLKGFAQNRIPHAMLQQSAGKSNGQQIAGPGFFELYSPFSLGSQDFSASGCGIAMTL